ncbi:MAG TPA: dihydrolipoamide acetyltransferase family protein, partial [Pseudonocardia sp.]
MTASPADPTSPGGARREFRLPDVGEGLTEAEVLAWRVAPGDPVAENDVLVEVETAKAAVELPSPFAGTVAALLVEPGVPVPVGTPIIAIDTVGPTGPAPDRTAGAAPDGRVPNLVGYGPRTGPTRRRPRRAATPPAADLVPAPAPYGVPPGRQQGGTAGTGRQQGGTADIPAKPAPAPALPGEPVPLAKPPVRKLARDLGVDLRAVAGTGPGGVITRDDVRGAAAVPVTGADGLAATSIAPTAPTASAAGTGGYGAAPDGAGVRREPVRGVRRATAAAVVASAFTAPHVTEFLAVDVTATMALRDRLRASREYAGVALSPLALVAKAVCLALRRTPVLNASWDDAAGEIVHHDRVRLGIAAATPRGLLVPNIRDADTLSLRELAGALAELAETARAGRTPPADLA